MNKRKNGLTFALALFLAGESSEPTGEEQRTGRALKSRFFDFVVDVANQIRRP